MQNRCFCIITSFVFVTVVLTPDVKSAETNWKFDFGLGNVESGYLQVLPTTIYTEELGYGFEQEATVSAIDRGEGDALRSDFCTSNVPFLFSIKLPEGNYKITITLGDKQEKTNTTIKAELRRLLLENIQTAPGEFKTNTIIVNVRTPNILPGGQVRLKDREKTTEFAAWDDKLTLELNGVRPCVCAMEITR